MQPAGAQPQQTVVVRVQVIDLSSQLLDLQVPTYLPARDLTQRVARDAGLGAYWDNGKRRLFWLRARGRVLQDHETLADLGVIDGELVYLLPEPPDGAIREQVPDYPENRGYAGRGTLAVLGALAITMTYATAWGATLVIERTSWTVMAPGLGLGFLAVSMARHLWGGQGSRVRVAFTGLVFYLLLFVLVFLPSVAMGESFGAVYSDSISGFILGMVGIFVGWLAWWGAVEPLPAREEVSQEVAQEFAAVNCGICSLDVQSDVRTECPYGCGRYFHSGCYGARTSVYRGDPRVCAVCTARVG